MQSKIIFITGCSSGIGYDAALALKQRGHWVIASCRKEKDVETLTTLGLTTVQMDMASPASITAGFEQAMQLTGGRLDVLINNAGYGQAGALEDIPVEVLREQFETNVFGLMGLTRLAIPIMRQQGQGRIINISSLLGFISMPFRGAYNASKYAVEGLSDTLRLELKPAGIEVITIEPGPIVSRFRDNAIDTTQNKIDLEQSHFKRQYQQMFSSYKQQAGKAVFTKEPSAVIKKWLKPLKTNNQKRNTESPCQRIYSPC